MKTHDLRQRLRSLNRSELEDLSNQVCGNSNSSLKNKEALIDVLLTKRRHLTAALGLQRSWLERNNVHVYGTIGLLSLILTAAAFLVPLLNDEPQRDPARDREAQLTYERHLEDTENEILEDAILRAATADRIWLGDSDVPEPTSSGFKLRDHEVITDLQTFELMDSVEIFGRRNASASTENIIVARNTDSPVRQYVNQMLINDSGAESYFLAAHTSGLEVFSSSNTHDGRLAVHASSKRILVGDYPVAPRMIEFDVSANPKGVEFPLQVTKTYWNAFQNADQSWVGTNIDLPTEIVKFMVIFPPERPFTDFELFINDENGERSDLPQDSYVVPHDRGLYIWWYIENPVVGSGYNIDWEW